MLRDGVSPPRPALSFLNVHGSEGQLQEQQIKRSVNPSPDKAAVVKALGGRWEDAEPWT